jgi:hypothetical protein
MNKKLLYIPAAVLFIGVFPLPIGYYTLLRLVVTAAAAYIAYDTFQTDKQSGWTWVFGFVAILFNPLIPIYLNKELWMIIDFATAILFIVYSRKIS